MTAGEVTRSGPITRSALDKNRSAGSAQPAIFKVIAYYLVALAGSRSERCCLFFLFFRSANKMPTFFLWFITFFRCSCSCHCCFGNGPKERLTHIMHMFVCMALYASMLWYIDIRAAYYERIELLFAHSLTHSRPICIEHFCRLIYSQKVEFTCRSHASIFFA